MSHRARIFSTKQERLANPHATSSTAVYYRPNQLQTIYNIPSSIPNLTGIGSGINVCVIIAFSYPGLQADFNLFCSTYHLPPQTLQIITMPGASADSGWAQEECLDVQMIHVSAPNAQIYVVEAVSNSYYDLFNAIQHANTMVGLNGHGMDVISMSWGGGEFSSQSSYDQFFTNPNICYCASSGDTQAPVEYPSSSPHVLCVGGTSVNATFNTNGALVTRAESTWNGGGCGVSRYTPAFSFSLYNSKKRACVDMALVANPYTGVVVVYQNSFWIFGGTSVSAPLTAGMIAVFDQVRKSKGQSNFNTINGNVNDLKKFIYGLPRGLFLSNPMGDITTGKDGIYKAIKNYDLPTGCGSFNVNLIVARLLTM